jgi:hypothetical protein
MTHRTIPTASGNWKTLPSLSQRENFPLGRERGSIPFPLL